MFPLLKTNNLTNVIKTLPTTQITNNINTHILLPTFPNIHHNITNTQIISHHNTFTKHITLLFNHYNKINIYLINTPHLYNRPKNPYHNTNLFTYTNNILHFTLLK